MCDRRSTRVVVRSCREAGSGHGGWQKPLDKRLSRLDLLGTMSETINSRQQQSCIRVEYDRNRRVRFTRIPLNLLNGWPLDTQVTEALCVRDSAPISVPDKMNAVMFDMHVHFGSAKN